MKWCIWKFPRKKLFFGKVLFHFHIGWFSKQIILAICVRYQNMLNYMLTTAF